MRKSLFTATVAMAILAGTLATPSEAGRRWKPWRYLIPDISMLDPRDEDYEDYYLDEEDYAAERAYARRQAAEEDMQYYEPEYVPPVKKKKAAAATTTTTKKKVAKQVNPVPKPKQKPATVAAKKAVTTTTAAKTAPAATATASAAKPQVAKDALTTASLTKPAEPAKPLLAKPAAPSAAMTCDKATGIVSGYGFASVTPKACSGETFAFNASRGGKSYEIKLSAATGELTEVKKLR